MKVIIAIVLLVFIIGGFIFSRTATTRSDYQHDGRLKRSPVSFRRYECIS